MGKSTDVDVAIIGAGSAGIAAAKTLRNRGLTFRVLEASHRVGGRALTEWVNGRPLDLGCHWLHSASLNPLVEIADSLGITYDREPWHWDLSCSGRWASEAEQRDYDRFFATARRALARAVESGRDVAAADVVSRDSRWTPAFDHWVSLETSADPDQVSAVDLVAYNDTNEDWEVVDGYGTLIARLGADIPVELNAAVEEIDWGSRAMRITTRKGAITATKVIVTVSTGVLGANDVRFSPPLPAWKSEAIAALPLGNHNRIYLLFDRDVFGSDRPTGVVGVPVAGEPMAFWIGPPGHNYAMGSTGGRFATWLERAGVAASVATARETLESFFGASITKHVVGHRVSAWGGDGWVKGAYAAARPGQSHMRSELARPLEERLFFAGEATSSEFFATAHGAYLTGASVGEQVAEGFAR